MKVSEMLKGLIGARKNAEIELWEWNYIKHEYIRHDIAFSAQHRQEIKSNGKIPIRLIIVRTMPVKEAKK